MSRGAPTKCLLIAAALAVTVSRAAAVSESAGGWLSSGGNSMHTGFTASAAITTSGNAQWTMDSDAQINGGAVVSADGKMVYFGNVEGFLFCLSAHTEASFGTALAEAFGGAWSTEWKVSLGSAIKVAPTLSADGTTLYIGAGSTFFAVNAATGATVWKVNTASPVTSAATVSGDLVFFGAQDGMMFSLNTKSGDEYWRCATKGSIQGAPATNANGTMLYFGSSDTSLVAVSIYGSSCTAGGFAAEHCASGSQQGVPYTGCGEWWVTPEDGAQLNQPVVFDQHNNRLYVTGTSYGSPSYMFGIDLSKVTKGTNQAATVVTKLFSSQQQLQTRAAIVDSTHIVFGCDDSYVYCVDSAKGTLKWKQAAGGAVVSSPVTDGSLVVFGANDKNVYALDASSGAVQWTSGADYIFLASPAVAPSGGIIIGDNGGYLHSINSDSVLGARILVGVVFTIVGLGLCCCFVRFCRKRRQAAALTLPGAKLDDIGRVAEIPYEPMDGRF